MKIPEGYIFDAVRITDKFSLLFFFLYTSLKFYLIISFDYKSGNSFTTIYTEMSLL